MPYAAQCRIAVPHSRSALARLGVALRAAGAEPLSIDFHRTDQSSDLVDLVIELPDDVDKQRLARLLVETGGGRLVSHLPPPVQPDPVLAVLSRCRDLLDASSPDELDRRASAAIASVCGTRTAIIDGLPRALGHYAARCAAERGRPFVQRTRDIPNQLDGHDIKEGWLLAVPDAGTNCTSVAVVVRPLTDPFLAAEIARVETILAIRRGLLADGLGSHEAGATAGSSS
jgi:hypothetical protein